MDRIQAFRDSPDWVHSVGLPPNRVHFREVHGTGHAVCDGSTGECRVHEDAANPHYHLVKHVVRDAPELVAGAAATVASFWLWKWKRKNLPF